MSRPAVPAGDALLELAGVAVAARIAAGLGCPHLATRAARRAAQLADLVVLQLSPACAATDRDDELERLGDVRTAGDLVALIADPVDVDDLLASHPAGTAA